MITARVFTTKMTSCVHLEQDRIYVFVISQIKITRLFLILVHIKFLLERIKIGWQEPRTLKLLKLNCTQSIGPEELNMQFENLF
jgi:hypothetical protein